MKTFTLKAWAGVWAVIATNLTHEEALNESLNFRRFIIEEE
jgi:hypothetical protein